MSAFTIEKLPLPTSRLFEPFPFALFYFQEINAHLESIAYQDKIASMQHASHLKCFHDPNLWKSLEITCESAEFEEIYRFWEVAKPFAHLNAAQMITLMKQHLIPLHNLLTTAHQDSGDNDTCSRILHNRLHALKQTQRSLTEALFQRAILYKAGFHKSFDDVLNVLSARFKDKTNYPLPIKYSSETMSDDIRLELHEWLSADKSMEQTEGDLVIMPIPLKAHQSFNPDPPFSRLQNALHKGLSNLEGFPRKVSEKKVSHDYFNNLLIDSKNWLASKTSFFIPDVFKNVQILLYRFRYVIYFILSLTFYSWMNLSAQFLFKPIITKAITQMIENVLFYTVGLLPLWHATLIALSSLYKKISNLLTYSDQSTLRKAYHFLVHSQNTLSKTLSRGVIELGLYDFESLLHDTHATLKQLYILEQNLILSPTKRLLLDPNLIKSFKETRNWVLWYTRVLKKQLQRFSLRCMNEFSNEIVKTTIRESHDLLPLISAKQACHIEAFINAFGDYETQKKLSDAKTLIPQWISDLKNKKARFQDAFTSKDLPYGGDKPSSDFFKRWSFLFKNVSPESQADHMLTLFEGTLNIEDSNAAFQKLSEIKPEIVALFQDHIWACLPNMPIQYVHYLSPSQKKIISSWYERHQEEIKAVEKSMASGLEMFPDTKQSLVDLMDVACIYHAIHHTNQGYEHTIRKAVSEYQGSHDNALHLLRHFNTHERPRAALNIVKKRLLWLLDNPMGHISSQDLELFYFPSINNTDFNVASLVENHPRYKTGIDDTFLKQIRLFARCHLIDEALVEHYYRNEVSHDHCARL